MGESKSERILTFIEANIARPAVRTDIYKIFGEFDESKLKFVNKNVKYNGKYELFFEYEYEGRRFKHEMFCSEELMERYLYK